VKSQKWQQWEENKMTELEGRITTIEDHPASKKVADALSINGLKIDKMEEVQRIGFKNPQQGYAIWIGEVLEGFEKKYNEILEIIPRGYSMTDWLDNRKSNYYTIRPEKRDILARRVMLKKAIDSLETKIEEERETSEGDNYIVDTYYRIKIDGKTIGLFIKYPNGDIWPAGF